MLAETRLKAIDRADSLVVVAAQGTRRALRLQMGRPGLGGRGTGYQEWLKATLSPEIPMSPSYPVLLVWLSLGHVRDIVSSHVLRKS